MTATMTFWPAGSATWWTDLASLPASLPHVWYVGIPAVDIHVGESVPVCGDDAADGTGFVDYLRADG